MGNMLALDIPQRVQCLISLILSLPCLGQRTGKVTLSLFLRFRELNDDTISHDSTAIGSRLTATVAACVRDAIASEIIEAGVVVAGVLGMRERIDGSITCSDKTRNATSYENSNQFSGNRYPSLGEHVLKFSRLSPDDGQGRKQVSFFDCTSATAMQCDTRRFGFVPNGNMIRRWNPRFAKKSALPL